MPPVRSMRVNASIWAAKNIGQSHHTHNTERWRRKVFIEGTTYIHDKQTTILLAAFNIIVSCNRQCVIPVKAITLTVKSTLCFLYTFFSLSSKGFFFFEWFIDLEWGEQHHWHKHSAPSWPGIRLYNFGCLPGTILWEFIWDAVGDEGWIY